MTEGLRCGTAVRGQTPLPVKFSGTNTPFIGVVSLFQHDQKHSHPVPVVNGVLWVLSVFALATCAFNCNYKVFSCYGCCLMNLLTSFINCPFSILQFSSQIVPFALIQPTCVLQSKVTSLLKTDYVSYSFPPLTCPQLNHSDVNKATYTTTDSDSDYMDSCLDSEVAPLKVTRSNTA